MDYIIIFKFVVILDSLSLSLISLFAWEEEDVIVIVSL